MGESADGQEQEIKVNDRRRFDAEGNPRSEESEAAGALPPPPPAANPAELAAAKGQLEASQKRVDELARGYQALMQEREEFKQRISRERERLVELEKAEVAQTLLDVVDELDLALKNAPEESPLAKGVRLIRDGILQKLQASGVERLQLLGQPYDPNLAEASDMELTPDPKLDHTIVAEARAGYRLKDRVIRPARVRVAKYVEPASA